MNMESTTVFNVENTSLQSSISEELFAARSPAFYVVWSLEAAAGLVLNSLFLISLLKANDCQSNTYCFMGSLAVVDLLNCCAATTYPMLLIATTFHIQDRMCFYGSMIGSSCVMCNALHVLWMGLDRYIAIIFPHK